MMTQGSPKKLSSGLSKKIIKRQYFSGEVTSQRRLTTQKNSYGELSAKLKGNTNFITPTN